MKGWKQIFQANGKEKKKKTQGSNTHIRQNRLQKKGHKKRPSIGAPKYIKKILEDFKKDIDSNTIIVGDFNPPLEKMDRSSKKKINKYIVALNNAIDEMELTNIYRAFCHKEAKYTFFSNIHGTF